MSKVSNPIHAVINTYCRRMTIPQKHEKSLYRFIWSLLQKRGCHLYRIGGIANHLHILFDLNANCALSDVIRDIKRESSKWMKHSGLFPLFDGWGKEYFAIGLSRENLSAVIEYIMNQRIHHLGESFEAEARRMAAASGSTWTDDLLT